MKYNLTVVEACQKYNLTINTLRSWLRDRKVKVLGKKFIVKGGRQKEWKVDENSLKEYLGQRNETEAPTVYYDNLTNRTLCLINKVHKNNVIINKRLNHLGSLLKDIFPNKLEKIISEIKNKEVSKNE